MAGKLAPEDPGLPLRLKHGIHTIFLFVNPIDTFDELTAELLETVRERYPMGLQQSTDLPYKTRTPDADDESVSIAYAKLRLPKDNKSGWVDMKIKGTETIGAKQLKDHAPVAFTFVKEGEAPEWIVSFPTLSDDGQEPEEQPEEELKPPPKAPSSTPKKKKTKDTTGFGAPSNGRRKKQAQGALYIDL